MAAGDTVLQTAELAAIVNIRGFAPHSCAIVSFGELVEEEDFFPADKFGDLKLKLTGEASAGAITVSRAQLRPGK